MGLTKFESIITIVQEDILNSWFGGMYNTELGNSLDPEDPLVAGHIHDGQHLDGHAQKVHLGNHVTGQLDGDNIIDRSIPTSKLSFSPGNGGGEGLAETLLIGNVTGGTDIIVSPADALKAPDGIDGENIFLNPGVPAGLGKHGSIYNFYAYSRGSRSIDFQNYNSDYNNRAEADFSTIFGGSINKIDEPVPAYAGTHNGAAIIGGQSCRLGGVESKSSVILSSGYSRLGVSFSGYVSATGKTYGIKNTVLSGSSLGIYGYGDNCINFGVGNKINQSTDTPYKQSSNFVSGGYNSVRTNVIYTGGYITQGSNVNTVLGNGNKVYISNNSFITGLNHWSMGNYNFFTGIGSRLKGDYSFVAGSFSRSVVATTKEECSYSASLGSKCYLYNRGQASLSGFTGGPPHEYGASNQSTYSLQGITSDGTPLILTTDGNTASSSFQRLRILPGTVYNFRVYLSAYQSGGASGTVSDSSTWIITGIIKRDLANNTTLVTSSGTGAPVFNDAGAAAWSVSVSADDTNEALVITASGEANKEIVWHAAVHSSEAGGYYDY